MCVRLSLSLYIYIYINMHMISLSLYIYIYIYICNCPIDIWGSQDIYYTYYQHLLIICIIITTATLWYSWRYGHFPCLFLLSCLIRCLLFMLFVISLFRTCRRVCSEAAPDLIADKWCQHSWGRCKSNTI